jgi:hypothetical protein
MRLILCISRWFPNCRLLRVKEWPAQRDGGTAAPGVVDSEFRLGWPVVPTCFAVAVFAWGFGGAFGPAVYLAELQHLYGWSAGTIGSGTTVSFVIGAGLLPWIARTIERLGLVPY